jgi:dTDP-4-amino-4,6-dideoxygalactose transaminase
MWNGLRPRFAECDDAAFQLDVQDAATRIDGAAALIATHVFGVPAPAEDVEKLARSAGIPVLFDAAHCLGALRRGRPIGGFGDAEVFSLSPTKPVVAGEGGLVSTNDDALAAAIRLGRGYGNPGDYNTRFAGLNARMSELHAAVALESLREIDEQLARRRAMADTYRSLLGGIPGVQFQAVDAGDLPTYKDFTIAITPEFGVTRDELVIALRREGVDTRCYFSPPVHRHQAYAHLPPTNLPVTDAVAGRVVSLPFFFSLSDSVISRIAEIVSAVQTNAERVAQAVRAASS